MPHIYFTICLLSFWFLTAPGLALKAAAGEKAAKSGADKKDDKKTEGIKISQTIGAGRVQGKIKAINDKSFTLVGPGGKPSVDLLIAEDAKVRLPAEQQFDEKGKPKRSKPDYSDPDRRLGGMKGAIEDLREGQAVIVSLGRVINKKQLVATIILVLPEHVVDRAGSECFAVWREG
jgi:hypothetical protein